MTASDSSQELLRRAKLGDDAALATLIEQFDPVLREQLHNEIPKRWQAVLGLDDLLQETYTDAFLDVAHLRQLDASSFQRWLTAIAKNNLVNAIESLEAEKRGGGRVPVPLGGQADSSVAFYEFLARTSSTPSRRLAKTEAVRVLNAGIEQLPEDYRLVVRPYDIEGQPAGHVARTMTRSEGAIFMLRARAHRALRKLLGFPLRGLSDYL
jgi:RNA polymerase sigma factor (sigma-70 family)